MSRLETGAAEVSRSAIGHPGDGRLGMVLFLLYLAWLVWLPLPIGSNRPIWVGIGLLWLTLLLGTWLLGWMSGAISLPGAVRRAGGLWALLLLVLGWMVAQWGLPGELAPAWMRAAYEAAGVDAPALTLDRTATLQALLETLMVCGAILITVLLVRNRRRLELLLWTLVWVGVVTAVAAGITVMERADWQVLGVHLSSGQTASGPFVNRNHFANYLVLTLSAGLGLLISMQSSHSPSGWRQRLRQWVQTLLGPKARLRIFLALMVITLVLTRSRMGNTAFFASLLITGGLALLLIRRRQRSLLILIASLVAIDILIVGTWFGVEQVVDRVQKSVTVTEEQIIIHDEPRMEANREALKIIRASPLTGTGAGTWFTVFPQWRASDHGFFDHAHNDYLEFAVDLGLPAVLLLLSLAGITALRGLLQLSRRNDPLVLGSAFASLMAILAMGIHATVDFSLHIPANAITFAVLVALPWLHGTQTSRHGAVQRTARARRP